MENYSKLLKNVALLMLFSLFPLVVYSQAKVDELLDDYVSTSINGENTTPYASRLNQLYKGYDKEDQTIFKDNLYNRIISVPLKWDTNGCFFILILPILVLNQPKHSFFVYKITS